MMTLHEHRQKLVAGKRFSYLAFMYYGGSQYIIYGFVIFAYTLLLNPKGRGGAFLIYIYSGTYEPHCVSE